MTTRRPAVLAQFVAQFTTVPNLKVHKAVSFLFLSNSLFFHLPIIRHYIIWASECLAGEKKIWASECVAEKKTYLSWWVCRWKKIIWASECRWKKKLIWAIVVWFYPLKTQIELVFNYSFSSYRAVNTLHLGYIQDIQCKYNVQWRRVRATIVAVEKQ